AVDSETEILTAWAPGIRPRLPRSRYVILRRRGQAPLASTYACVYEPWTDHRPVCGVTAASIYRSYPNAPGELLYIPGSALLLWKSSGPDAKLQIRLPVPRAGSYMLVIRHYRSPAYGTLSVSVGRSQEHHIQGNAPQVGPAEPFQIGPIDLPAGEVALEMRVSEPSPSGDYWFGFQQIDLCTSGSQGPQVSSLSVITPEPDNPSRAWPVAVRVDRSGGADYLATCPPDAEGASDRDQPIRWSGLAFWRTSAKKPERLVLLAGFLELPGIRAELKPAFWRGRVSDVDYDKWQVTCESSVPADGRINGSLILFSNPNYSRNTAYLVRSVRSLSGGRHVIELSGEPTLGVLRVDNLVAAERRFESIIPHEYMRGLGRPTLFFAGKRLDAGGEPLAHIVSADYGAPCLVTVDTAERLREGQLLYVRDIQPGDEFFIPGSAAIDLTAQAPRLLAANTDVALMLEGKAYQLKWPGKLR
ncbi:MAG: hypothetical protein H5T86_09110, partial [Armatimonadetes bacterium]|nr:hypothetical protein [Armatimonadota bacterium]